MFALCMRLSQIFRLNSLESYHRSVRPLHGPFLRPSSSPSTVKVFQCALLFNPFGRAPQLVTGDHCFVSSAQLDYPVPTPHVHGNICQRSPCDPPVTRPHDRALRASSSDFQARRTSSIRPPAPLPIDCFGSDPSMCTFVSFNSGLARKTEDRRFVSCRPLLTSMSGWVRFFNVEAHLSQSDNFVIYRE